MCSIQIDLSRLPLSNVLSGMRVFVDETHEERVRNIGAKSRVAQGLEVSQVYLGLCGVNSLFRFRGDNESNAYSMVTPLRMLLLEEEGGDNWARTDALMDHREERLQNEDEWNWYQQFVVDFFRRDLRLEASEDRIQRAVGILNVNAVALHFGKLKQQQQQQQQQQQAIGKGLYPIFAIMSHNCVCNAR